MPSTLDYWGVIPCEAPFIIHNFPDMFILMCRDTVNMYQ